MNKNIHNVLAAPIVLLVRLPLMLVLLSIAFIGEKAQDAAEWVSDHIPGLIR
jgi:hypothetical protein